MTLANRDAFIATARRRYCEFEVNGVGKVKIQNLSELERAEVEVSVGEDKKMLLVWLFVFSVVDENGNLMYGKNDLDLVASFDSRIVRDVNAKIQEHSFGERKDFEELVKN